MVSRQTLIARGDGASAVLLEMTQEDPNKVGIDVGDEKPVPLLPHLARREHDKKTQRIPVALLCVP